MNFNCVIVTQITNETETRGEKKMTRAYCEAMVDAIIRKNKTVPHATKQIIGLDRLKGITNTTANVK